MLTEEDDEKFKETKAFLEDSADCKKLQKKSQPASAFLGPQIWKKPLTLNQIAGDEDDEVENSASMDVTGPEFSVMNVEDFLAENDFDFGNVSPTTKADIYEVESRGSHRENIPKTIRRSDYRLVVYFLFRVYDINRIITLL